MRWRYEIIYTQVPTESQRRSQLCSRHPWQGQQSKRTPLRIFRQRSEDVRPWISKQNVGQEKVNIAILCQSISVCLFLSLFHTFRNLGLSLLQKEIYFCKQCVMVSSFLPYNPSFLWLYNTSLVTVWTAVFGITQVCASEEPSILNRPRSKYFIDFKMEGDGAGNF